MKKPNVEQVWKLPWVFPRFFQRNPTLQNMKIFCIFFQGYLNQTWPEIWKLFAFFQRFFQRNPILTKHGNHFFGGVFSKTFDPFLCFCPKFLSLTFIVFLQWKMWDHWTFNTQCHNFFLTLWMWPHNGKSHHFFLHIYSFTQIYSSMVMVVH